VVGLRAHHFVEVPLRPTQVTDLNRQTTPLHEQFQPRLALRRLEQLRVCLAGIDDPPSRAAVDAERAFLAELGGGCDLPAGAYATVEGSQIDIEALIAAPDGSVVLRERAVGADPGSVGSSLATHLLDHRGGRDLFG